MSIYEHRPDLTAKIPAGGGGMDLRLLYLCNHKGLRAGGKFLGNIPRVCPACNAKEQK